MEVWKCLEVLRKSDKSWLFGREKYQNEKLIALDRLSNIAPPSTIIDLFPFLKSSSDKVRNATIQTISELFNKLKGKKAFYDVLKSCQITNQDLVFYKSNFETDKYVLLMKISSLNRSGYIREKALRELGRLKKKDILPFIIFRLADWVPNVRQVAKEELRQFIVPKFQQGLIDNLSLFDWLQTVERTDLSAVYEEVISFLVIINRSETFKSFPNLKDKERRILANELCDTIQSDDELKQFLKDKHFLIRILAVKHFDKLSPTQKEKLLHDKSARVRQSILYKFKNDENFKILLLNFLADKSGTIRHFARFHLKGKGTNFKAFYTNNLNNERQVIGSLLGLLDIEAKDCESFIEHYLESNQIKTVKTAFYVLSKLYPDKAFNFAKINLFTNQIGLRNQIIEYFGKNTNKKILELARKQYQEAGEDIKLSILKLFSITGGYSIFPDLLLGTIDKSEVIRTQARILLQKWKSEAVNIFKMPDEDEKKKAIDVFKYVNAVHIEEKYFTENPVKGLDFYIK